MLELLTSPQAWAAFTSLCVMEIVLGIDNVIFISILVGALPEPAATRARQIGLLLALVFRVGLLFAITWIIGLTAPVFTVPFDLPGGAEGHRLFDPEISWRDLILIGGGLFLIVKGTREIHGEIEHEEARTMSASFSVLIARSSSSTWCSRSRPSRLSAWSRRWRS
jgi:predicted tellurium resistance membrane protein TerC